MKRPTHDLTFPPQLAPAAASARVSAAEPPVESTAELPIAEVRMGVYAIRNTADGALFVGSAPDVDARWGHHRDALDRVVHPNDALQAAWTRQGAAAFELVVLECVVSTDQLADAEQWWSDLYSTDDLHHVYNGQSRVIRKLRALLTLDQAAQRLGLRPARLRRWVNEGRVSCHHALPAGSSRTDSNQVEFDHEELGEARERILELEGHRVANVVATLRVRRERVGRWLHNQLMRLRS
jgi:predicted GIY-YIG superfamily endonuclease